MHNLRDATIVITGASSGNGRAAALAFARRGARIALAARRAEALEELAKDCEALGAQAIAVPTDVADLGAVRRLADGAAQRLGPIRVWINNAGVGAVGAYAETPMEAHRRVIETNLIGYMNGAHAVLPHFFARKEGVLINNISLGAWAPAPFAVAYSASKYGVLGFSEALDAELTPWPRIHVCDVFPSFMNTPGVQHGANYTGRVLKPAPPVYDPQHVADAFVRLALRPRRATVIGAPALFARAAHAFAPRLTGFAAWAFIQFYLRQADPAPVTDGALFEPMAQGTTARGGWDRQNRPLIAAAAALAGLATAGSVLRAGMTGRR